MGQRSNTETIIAILKAFLDRKSWQQAELARHVGVQPATIHKQLTELAASGVPRSRATRSTPCCAPTSRT